MCTQSRATQRVAHDDGVDAEDVPLVVVAHGLRGQMRRVVGGTRGDDEAEQRLRGVVAVKGGVAEMAGIVDTVVQHLTAGGFIGGVASQLQVGHGGQVDYLRLL